MLCVYSNCLTCTCTSGLELIDAAQVLRIPPNFAHFQPYNRLSLLWWYDCTLELLKAVKGWICNIQCSIFAVARFTVVSQQMLWLGSLLIEHSILPPRSEFTRRMWRQFFFAATFCFVSFLTYICNVGQCNSYGYGSKTMEGNTRMGRHV